MSDIQDADALLELDVPEGVPEAEQAVELIRAWVADGHWSWRSTAKHSARNWKSGAVSSRRLAIT